MERPDDTTPPAATPAGTTRHWSLPRLPLLIGVIGLGAVVTTGGWLSRRASAERTAALSAVQTELAAADEAVTIYRQRLGALQWQAAKLRTAAEEEKDTALRGWARERARLFEAFVAKIAQEEAARRFEAVRSDVTHFSERRDPAKARERLAQLPKVRFPPAEQVRAWRAEIYARPLADISRATPATYRALRNGEPDVAAEDIARLREQLSGAAGDTVTPQAMMAFELLSAVVPPDDPVVADWAAVANAADYFEQPDAATVAHWRKAQAALRQGDTAGAAAHMQAIDRTTIRTRLPFRAAYGKTLLKNQPDQIGAAYPFLEEAARAGDAQARAAVAAEDFRQKRYARALAWQEAALADGDATAVEPLVALLAMPRDALPRDPAREAGELRRIVAMPDAPPLSELLLGRIFESGQGETKSAETALAHYRRAAERGLPEAMLEVARCLRGGIGAAAEAGAAGDWAARAYLAGEREKSLELLLELMKEAPDQVASGVQAMLEHQTVAAPAGYEETRIEANGRAALKAELARYFDRRGEFGKAARLYAQSGSRSAEVLSRQRELTTAHPCETCGGAGKIQSSIPCATCGGKGTVICHVCDGRGYNFVPGTPPCSTCGGSGSVEREGKVLACSACGGTGKGKGSVVKQECKACSHGREPCRDCTGGRIMILKECPDCHGNGVRALADE